VFNRAVEKAASFSTFAERGRIAPEVGDPAVRYVLVFHYRLVYRVREHRVVIRGFVHGARNFSTWMRSPTANP
jgi:hypothetical protein